MRRTRRLLLGFGLPLILVGSWAWIEVRRQLPDDAAAPIPGLSAAVQVRFDGRGTPALQSASLQDAFRVQGYLVARERFFQMELMRRKADGRLAELVGAGALRLDRLHRIYGFGQVARAALAELPAQQRGDLEAYAAGVNAYLASHPGRLGLEFRLLRLRPEPWAAEDCLKVLLLMHEDLSTSWKSEVQAEALEGLPQSTRRFLLPRIAAGDLPLVPDAQPAPRPDPEALLSAPRSLPAAAQIDSSRLVALAAAMPTPDPERRAASNNWVIAGGRTRSGKPILANDPHLDLGLPGIWYPVRFEWGGRFAQGVALPGLPGIVIGHNDRVAWGFTNLGTDVQDLYRERPRSHRPERILVKKAAPEELQVALGRHGPQVLPGLSLAWAALDPRLLRIPTAAIMEARDWASFNAAVDGFTGPAQNMVYADRDGHIGWRASGVLPLRRPGDDGSRIKDGEDPANDWRGFLPQAEMPRVLDPTAGFIATANNRVIGTSFAPTVATEWAGVSRVQRIVERLAAEQAWDASRVSQLQMDPTSRTHRILGRWIAATSEGRAFVPGDWNGEALREDPVFTRVELVRRALRKRLLQALLKGSGLAWTEYRWMEEDAWLLAAVEAAPEAWRMAGLGDKAATLAACLEEARRQPEWNRSWGRVNELHIHHPFGLGGGLLAWILDPPAAQISGSAKSIRVLSGTHGQSMRMVVDLADPDATRLVLPLGVSGHYGSPHRIDQAKDWQEGDPAGDRTRLHQPATGSPLVFAKDGVGR